MVGPWQQSLRKVAIPGFVVNQVTLGSDAAVFGTFSSLFAKFLGSFMLKMGLFFLLLFQFDREVSGYLADI